MYLPLDSRSLPVPNISELHREGRRFHCSSQRFPHRRPSTRDCQFHCQHSSSLFHSCNGTVASQRVRNKDEEKKKAYQQQSRHSHPDDQHAKKSTHIAMLIGRTCALHRLRHNPRLPSIPQDQFHRCQSRLPSDVLALRPLAAMLELTLYLSLVVRQWCRAFLFDHLSMEEDFAEDVRQLVDVVRILWKSRV